jgi:hypothetical protein
MFPSMGLKPWAIFGGLGLLVMIYFLYVNNVFFKP